MMYLLFCDLRFIHLSNHDAHLSLRTVTSMLKLLGRWPTILVCLSAGIYLSYFYLGLWDGSIKMAVKDRVIRSHNALLILSLILRRKFVRNRC